MTAATIATPASVSNRANGEKSPSAASTYAFAVDLTVRITQGPTSDGRSPASLPDGWCDLALAAAGDPGKAEWVARLAGSSRIDEHTLSLAARKIPSFATNWPWGPDALGATVSDDASLLGQWRHICLGRREDVAGRVAHVDTTTLANAVGLIDGSVDATPATVMDFAGLINTLCIYEQVCYLENCNVTLAQLESMFAAALFKELPVASTQLSESPYHILGDVKESLRRVYKTRTVPWLNDVRDGAAGTEDQQRAWIHCWETLLGRPCDAQWLLRDPDEGGSLEYPDIGWDSPTAELLDNIVTIDQKALAAADRNAIATSPPAREARHRNLFAQMSNARALFNAHIAEILGVRYAAGLARVPILGLVERDTRDVITTLLREPLAAATLQRAYGVGAELCARNKPDVLMLPFFAAEVFQRASTPSEVPDVLLSVRAQCSIFRSHMVELNQALQAGDARAVQQIHASLGPVVTKSLWRRVGLPAKILTAAADFIIAWLEPSRLCLNIVVALLGPLLDDDMRAAILGQSRVHYDLVGDMRPLADSGDALIQLWRPPNPDVWLARLNALTNLSPTGRG